MAKKNKIGFWRAIIIFLFGAACGTGAIAVVAAYVNELHLPFIKEQDKTHLPGLSQQPDQGRREALEFQDILRQQSPVPIIEESQSQQDAPARQFDYYLQIGAFKNQKVAEDLRARMILGGHEVIIDTGVLADNNLLYRVWVGPYANENEAEQQRAQLSLEGYGDVQLLQKAR